MRWAEISVEVPPSSVEPVSAALTEAGCAGVVVHDPHAVSSDPYAEWVTQDEGRAALPSECRVAAYLPVDDRLEATLNEVQERLERVREAGLDPGSEITLRTVDEESWADAWKAYFKPLRVGSRFVIKPSWEAWDAAADDLIIEIDPGMAFGSGSHPTTQLCLKALETVVQPGDQVLDWGTGSGILAVGAARLGAASVLAVDLDPVAVRAAEENAARNDYQQIIRTDTCSIQSVEDSARFDLVLANIVADPIIAGAADLARTPRVGGHVLISGIIDRREDEVRAALEQAGLSLQQAFAQDEWRALLLKRLV